MKSVYSGEKYCKQFAKKNFKPLLGIVWLCFCAIVMRKYFTRC